MIKCAYCEYEARRNSGLASHVAKLHKDKWKGNLKASFPEGYNPGEQEPMRRQPKLTKKGKEAAPTVCPFCGHNSRRAQGLAAHLKGAHPDKWKGNMGSTLGLEPSRPWKKSERGKTRSQKWLETRWANLKNAEEGKKKYMDKWYDRKKEEALEDPRGYINCCPNCGTELAPYYLAAGAMNRRIADRSLSVLQEGLRRAEARRS